MSYSLTGDPGGSGSVLSQHQHYVPASQANSGTLMLAPIPEGVIGLVRDGGVPQSNLPLPEAIVQVDLNQIYLVHIFTSLQLTRSLNKKRVKA